VGQAKPTLDEAPTTQRATVTFAKSGKTAVWDGSVSTLHELATAHHVRIDYSCGAGSCGTCAVAVRSGAVTYKDAPGYAIEAGSCLTCVGCPKGDLTLDA
jgi:ferredoxin